MSAVSSRKKRPGLLEVVNKLSLGVSESKSHQMECDEDFQENTSDVYPQERRASASSFHLAKTYVPPGSPMSSESSDEIPEKEKEEAPKESGPVEPMRCGVCGLRVYKSYRYISRTSAPNHLKNFFDPDTDRFRVCKRCHSSKERCRQNLSLILLKSETEQYIHLRSPLGTTHHRRSHSMKFLTRDIGRSLKRPYEDLICDETLDEDYLSDIDDGSLPKAKKKPLSAGGTMGNNCVEMTNGMGVVTVVRPNSNTFQVYPNHFTTYGEITKVKEEGKDNNKTEMTTIKIFNKKPEEKSTESESELAPENVNGELKSEIKTINYKLTLLDHAYALPAAKTAPKVFKSPKPVVPPPKPPKVIKTESLAKTAIRNMIKNNSQVKKKESSTSTDNKDQTPARTCGIICCLCSNLVTKSYSCYRKENAPEKIRPFFTGDIKIMKVCRRCVPYKKPKSPDEASAKSSKNKVKISINKFLKQKVKNARKIAKLEGRHVHSDSSAQTKELPKTTQKPSSEEQSTADVKTEVEPPKEKTVVHVSPKQDSKMLHVSIKNGKLETTTSNKSPENTFPPIATAKDTEVNQTKTTVLNEQQKSTMSSQPSVVLMKLENLTDSVLKAEDKVSNTASSIDSGTQPMQSMIGVKKTKQKTAKNEDNKKDEPPEKNDVQNPESMRENDKEKENKEKAATKKDDLSDEKAEKKDQKEKKKDNKKEEKKDTKKTVKKEETKEDKKTEKKEEKTEKKEEKAENKAEKSEDSKQENKPSQTKEINDETTSKPTESKPLKPLKAPLSEPIRSSPRRDKNIVPPEKKKDTETKQSSSVATRTRRGVSESESESGKSEDRNVTKSSDDTSDSSNKADTSLKRSTRKGRGVKRKDSESSSTNSVDNDKKDTKKAKVDSGKDGKPNRNYSTRYGHSPTKCCCCNETGDKLCYVQNGRAPAHIKPLFERDGTSTLRICRKCLNCRSRVKSFV